MFSNFSFLFQFCSVWSLPFSLFFLFFLFSPYLFHIHFFIAYRLHRHIRLGQHSPLLFLLVFLLTHLFLSLIFYSLSHSPLSLSSLYHSFSVFSCHHSLSTLLFSALLFLFFFFSSSLAYSLCIYIYTYISPNHPHDHINTKNESLTWDPEMISMSRKYKPVHVNATMHDLWGCTANDTQTCQTLSMYIYIYIYIYTFHVFLSSLSLLSNLCKQLQEQYKLAYALCVGSCCWLCVHVCIFAHKKASHPIWTSILIVQTFIGNNKVRSNAYW